MIVRNCQDLILNDVSIINSLILTAAVLITGGEGALQSAEIYQPNRHSACVLPDLPDQRYGHTQDGSLLCGGWGTNRSCRRWNSTTGAWDLLTESLTKKRRAHTSWTPHDSLTYLMGGWKSEETSEVLNIKSNVSLPFPLQHKTA